MTLIGPGGRPITSQPANNAASGNSPHIKDSGLATFAADVLEQSRTVPVIVDFWAPWCGPCKTLGPSLEATVEAANGAVKLVKVNIDENPEIAQQLRIQSIPTVYAFRNGQPVDGFMGAIPDSQIKAFVATLAGGGSGHDHHHHGGPEHTAEVLAVAGEALTAGDFEMAARAYGHVLEDEPGHPEAVAGLARAFIAAGDVEQARATLQLVRPDAAQHEAILAVQAELAPKAQDAPVVEEAPAAATESPETIALRAKVEADPKDHQARYDLALALDNAGDIEGAIEQLLELIRRDRKWNEEAARKHLVALFETLGFTDPRSIDGRRKLSGILFS
jgi:putative thioredoxin